IVQGRFQRPLERAPGLDVGLAAAIEKALSADPAQRFASCEEFAAALAAPAPVAESVLLAGPPRAAPKRRGGALLAGAAVLVVAGLAAALVLDGAPAPKEAVPTL